MPINFVGAVNQRLQFGETGGLAFTLPSLWGQYDFGVLVVEAPGDPALMTAAISGASGWTQRHDRTTVSDINVTPHETWVWTKHLAASEASPVVTISGNSNDARGGVLALYRGVDRDSPVDVITTTSQPVNITNATNPAQTPVTDGCAIVLIQASTFPGADASTRVAPTGYTMAESVRATINSIGLHVCVAHLLNAGAAGTVTPTAWQHSPATSNTMDNHLLTMALRPADPVFEPLIGSRHKQRFTLRHF